MFNMTEKVQTIDIKLKCGLSHVSNNQWISFGLAVISQYYGGKKKKQQPYKKNTTPVAPYLKEMRLFAR